MAAADIHFYETVVASARSPRLEQRFATLAAESRMHPHAYPPYPSLQNVNSHERILEAAESRSAEAVALLRERLRLSARLAVNRRTHAPQGWPSMI